MSSITVHHVSKSYSSTAILNEISLKIEDGEFVSLLGPSGCGKSTLLRLIAGLDETDQGTIFVGNHNVTHLPPKARDLSMVFQSYALYPHLNVFENIAVPLKMRYLTALERLPFVSALSLHKKNTLKKIKEEVSEIASALDLHSLLNRKPAQLSGGQRQRVALGRAMVRKPQAFLMDEPLSNLDAKLRVQMRSELSQLHRKLKTTFLYVTHDQSEALTMSDRIAVMMGGKILQFDTPDEIYNNPSDLRVAEFVGSPRINLMQGQIEQRKIKIHGIHENKLTASTLQLEGDAPHGTQVVLAFRSENAYITDAHSAEIRGLIKHIENLGSDTYYYIESTASSDPIIVRTPAQSKRLTINQHVGIALDSEPLVFFPEGPRVDCRSLVDHTLNNPVLFA